MTRPTLFVLVALALSIVGCGRAKPDTYDEVRTLFQEFVKPGADRKTLTAKLRPTKADYEAVFEPEFAARFEAIRTPQWDAGTALNPEANDFKVHWVTTDELKNPKSSLPPGIPEQYRTVADKYKPGITIYGVEMWDKKKPDAQFYVGLIKVNGNWRFFPKPWEAK